MTRARIFISYAHGTTPSKERVLQLATRLRNDGFDVAFDQFVPEANANFDWPGWMESQMQRAEFVLVVGSEAWLRRYDGRDYEAGRGVTWEGTRIAHELYELRTRNRRFIPIVVDDAIAAEVLPLRLRVHGYYQLTKDYDKLVAFLAHPALGPDPIGPVRRDRDTPYGASFVPIGPIRNSSPSYIDTGILDAIEAAITAEPRKAVVVYGPPGAGKTQAVAEIVHRRRQRTWFTLWIDASSEPTWRKGFQSFLAEVAPEWRDTQGDEMLKAMHRALDRVAPSLLVLDDLEDHTALSGLLPPPDGIVLVTSRKLASAVIATAIEVRPLHLDESIRLLQSVAGRVDDYRALAAEADGIPLALQQAGQYLKATSIGAAEYLERLRTELRRVLERHHGDDDQRTRTIHASLKTSLSGADREAPHASRVYTLLSLFGERPLQQRTARALLQLVNAGPPLARIAIDDAFAALARYTVVRLEEGYLTSPSLFLRMAREQCAADELHAAARTWANADLPKIPDASDLYPALARFVLYLDLDFAARMPLLKDDAEHAQVANWRVLAYPAMNAAKRLLKKVDEPLLAAAAYRHLLAALETVPGKQPWVVRTRCELTQSLAWSLAQAKYGTEALPAAALALELTRALKEKSDARDLLANALTIAAYTELRCGDLERGLAHADAALALDEAPFGVDHASTLDIHSQILHQLAHEPGKEALHQRALRELTQANQLREAANDPESIALGKANLAHLLACTRFPSDVAEAFEAAVDAYRYYRRTLPAHASEVATTLKIYSRLALRCVHPDDAPLPEGGLPPSTLLDEAFGEMANVIGLRSRARRFDADTIELFMTIFVYATVSRGRFLLPGLEVLADAIEAMAAAECTPQVFADALHWARRLLRADPEQGTGWGPQLDEACVQFERTTGLTRRELEAMVRSKGEWE